MKKRFDGNVEPFAKNSTSTNRTIFGDITQSDDIDDNLNTDFRLGWEIVGINDNPTKQDFNAMGYTTGYLLSYLYQNGIPSWNDKQEYFKNSYSLGGDGRLYRSKNGEEGSPNLDANPISDRTNWTDLFSNSGNRSIVDLNLINNEDAALYRYDLTTQGSGSGNVIQGFAIDPFKNELFSHHVTGDNSVFNLFAAHGEKSQTSTHYNSTSLSTIGHQGFSISWDESGQRWFWTSANESISDYQNKVTRFQIEIGSGTELVISNIQHLQLYSGTSSGHCTPAVSIDGRYLISETVQNNIEYVRVFDLNELNDGGVGDYSDKAIYEFSFDYASSDDYPLQSMACDSSYIYIFFGDGDMANDNYVKIYTIDGKLIHTINDFIIGKTLAQTDGDGLTYEQEGVGWVWNNGKPYLAAQIASGNSGARVSRIFALGANLPNVSYGNGNTPAFMSVGTNDFGVPENEAIRFGHYNSLTDTFNERLAIDSSGNMSIKSFESGTFRVTVEDSTTKGAGNISSTTATGNFVRMGNMMNINFKLSNINISGLTAATNAILHFEGLSNPTFFEKLAAQDTWLQGLFNDITLNASIQLVAELNETGYIVIKELRDGGTHVIADVSQIDGADIYVSGSYQIDIV